MRALLVFAERFAVVGGDDDQGVGQQAAPAEFVEGVAEPRVRKCNLTRVAVVGKAGLERLGRVVGVVGIVEVHPGEPRLACRLAGSGRGRPIRRRLGDPLHRRRQHHVGRTFHLRQLGARWPCAVAVVVDVEAGVQAEAGVQDERGDERTGAIAGTLQRARPASGACRRSGTSRCRGHRSRADRRRS